MVICSFSWPEGSPSPPANHVASAAAAYHHSMNMPGMNGGFGMFHTALH